MQMGEISGFRVKVMEMVVFWEVTPCSLIDIDLRFRTSYCLHHQGDPSSLPLTLILIVGLPVSISGLVADYREKF
jgi:hypothetical protein